MGRSDRAPGPSLLGQVHRHELPSLLYCTGSLFCILASYFVLVPLREDAGISLGTNTLPKLFTASLFGVLLLTPVASAWIGRPHVPKATSLRQCYQAIGLVFVGFYLAYYLLDGHSLVTNAGSQQLLATGAAAAGGSVSTKQGDAGSNTGAQQQQLHASEVRRHLQAVDASVNGNADGFGWSHALAGAGAAAAGDEAEAQSANAGSSGQRVRDIPQATAALSRSGQDGVMAPLPPPAVNKPATASKEDAPRSDAGGGASHTRSAKAKKAKPPFDIKTGDPSLTSPQRAVRALFYVWLNVQNLVVASSMWARCADSFSSEAASRLFGIISAGSTLGQLLGSLTTVAAISLAPSAAAAAGASSSSTLAPLMLLAAALMFAAGWLQARLPSPTADKAAAERIANASSVGGAAQSAGLSVTTGGSSAAKVASAGAAAWRQLKEALEGFSLIRSSHYLQLLCGYLLMTYVVGSLMYFQRSQAVASAVHSSNDRAAFFARLYSASASAILLLQLLATGRMLKRIGLTAALLLFPAVCGAGMAAVAVWPSPSTVSLVEVVRKVLGYALVRPAREVLFTVVSRQEKYKAKIFIDAVVQRLGDSVAALVFEIVDVQMKLGPTAIAMAGLAACAGWGMAALQLGWRHSAMANASALTPSASKGDIIPR